MLKTRPSFSKEEGREYPDEKSEGKGCKTVQ
jgi:hypothetical protein